MKKILSIFALSTMASSTTPTFSNLILITSVNKGSVRVVEPILKKLDTTLGKVIKFNDHLAVSITDNFKENSQSISFVNDKGEISKNIKTWSASFYHNYQFYRINNQLGVLIDVVGDERNGMNAYLIDDNGNLTKLSKNIADDKPESIPNFYHWSDHLALFRGASHSGGDLQQWFLLSDTGNLTKLSKEFRKMDFNRVNNNLAIVYDGSLYAENRMAYFLHSDGRFQSLFKEANQGTNDYSPINDFKGVFNDNTGESYLLDSDKNFKDLGKKGNFVKINDEVGLFSTSDRSYLLDKNGNFSDLGNWFAYYDLVKFNDHLAVVNDKNGNAYFLDDASNLTSLKQKFKPYSLVNNNLVIGVDNENETWLLDDKGQYTDLKVKTADKNYFNQTFLSLNDENGLFKDKNGDWYLFTSPYNPNDIDKLNKSIHFDKTFSNQYIEKINVPLYQGIASNGTVKLNIWHDDETVLKNITKVSIDGNVLGKTGDRYTKDIETVGKHEIVIYNKLTTNLIFTLYIKNKSTIDTITNVSREKMTNYVGVDNQNNPIDVLQSPSEIQISYDSFLFYKNTISSLNENFKIVDTTNILTNQTFSTFGKYLIETQDLVGNKWQQYLTLGDSTILKYWDSKDGKDLWTKALEHKYTEEQLNQMNSSEIKDLIIKSKDWKYPINLENITNLDLGEIFANDKSKYIDLIPLIINSKELQDKNGNKLLNPIIKFMDMSGKDISNELEQKGQFEIEIIADENDPNFIGKTKNIILTLTAKPIPPLPPIINNSISPWIWIVITLGIFGGIVVALFSGNKFLHAKRSNKKNIKARKFVDEQIKELEKEKK